MTQFKNSKKDLIALLIIFNTTLFGDNFFNNNYNNHGSVGLINMPTARFYDESSFGITAYDGTPDQKVTLTLNHNGRFPAISMGHNFVLIKKDVDVNEYALRAAGARNSEYIPEGDNEIAYTKMLGGGESDTITFDAPEPGKYVFICSFPGHYQLMMGEFIVV